MASNLFGDDLPLIDREQGLVRDPYSGGYYQVSPEEMQMYFPERPAPAPPTPAEPPEPMTPEWADYGRLIMRGGASLGAGAGWLMKAVGLEDVGGAIETLGNDAVDYWTENLTPAMQKEMAKQFVVQNPETGEYEWGDAGVRTALAMGAESVMGTMAGMGFGAGITKVLQAFGNPVGRGALVKAVNAVANKGAAATPAEIVAGAAAAKKLAVVDSVLGVAGFGLGEGGVSAMTAAPSAYEMVKNMDPAKLANNERYRQVFDSTDDSMTWEERHAYAADTVAMEAASVAGFQSGLTTALLGAPMGAFFGKLIGKSAQSALSKTPLRAGLTGALGEAAQEFGQSGSEQYIANKTAIKAGDLKKDPWEGVLNQAVGGAIAGAVMGGPFGVFESRQQPQAQPTQPGTPPPPPAVPPGAIQPPAAGTTPPVPPAAGTPPPGAVPPTGPATAAGTPATPTAPAGGPAAPGATPPAAPTITTPPGLKPGPAAEIKAKADEALAAGADPVKVQEAVSQAAAPGQFLPTKKKLNDLIAGAAQAPATPAAPAAPTTPATAAPATPAPGATTTAPAAGEAPPAAPKVRTEVLNLPFEYSVYHETDGTFSWKGKAGQGAGFKTETEAADAAAAAKKAAAPKPAATSQPSTNQGEISTPAAEQPEVNWPPTPTGNMGLDKAVRSGVAQSISEISTPKVEIDQSVPGGNRDDRAPYVDFTWQGKQWRAEKDENMPQPQAGESATRAWIAGRIFAKTIAPAPVAETPQATTPVVEPETPAQTPQAGGPEAPPSSWDVAGTGEPIELSGYRSRAFGSDDSDKASGRFYAETEEGAAGYGYGTGVTETINERIRVENPLVVETKDDAIIALFGKDSPEREAYYAAKESPDQDAERVADELIAKAARESGHDAVIYLADTNLYGTPTRSIHVLGQQFSPGVENAAGSTPETTPPAPESSTPTENQPAPGEQWWDKELTPAGRAAVMKQAGIKLPALVKWRNVSPENKAKLEELRAGGLTADAVEDKLRAETAAKEAEKRTKEVERETKKLKSETFKLALEAEGLLQQADATDFRAKTEGTITGMIDAAIGAITDTVTIDAWNQVKALVTGESEESAKFWTGLQAEAQRRLRKAQRDQYRNPEVYKAALMEAAAEQSIPANEVDAFRAGFDHALAGKTKSTLTGESMEARQRGYESGRRWAEDTDEGRAWYSGKEKTEKLKGTGERVKRWWDQSKLNLKDAGTLTKLWASLESRVARGALFKPALAENASPGLLRWVDELRSDITSVKERIKDQLPQSYYGDEKSLAAVLERLDKHEDEERKERYAQTILSVTAEYIEAVGHLSDTLDGVATVADAAAAFDSEYYEGETRKTERGSRLNKFIGGYGMDAYTARGSRTRAFTKTESDPYKVKPKTTPLLPPKLDRIDRTGMTDYRQGRNVTPKEMKETFGFGDIDFGNWVAGGEDQDNLNYAYDSFMDLAQMLGQDPKIIGLGGTLHFSIGRTGHGKHAAHYTNGEDTEKEGGKRVPNINLTKTKGDGTIAHEWSHALDDFLGREHKAIERIYSYLKTGIRSGPGEDGWAKILRDEASKFITGGWYYKDMKKAGAEKAEMAKRRLRNIRASEILEAKSGGKKTHLTQFYNDALDLDSSEGSYWTKPTELLARASESWAYDALNKQGQRSTYMVNPWVAEGVAKPPTYRGIPYPRGPERLRLNAAVAAYYAAIEMKKGRPTLADDALLEYDATEGFEEARQQVLAEIDEMARKELERREAEQRAREEAKLEAERLRQAEEQRRIEEEQRLAEEQRKALEAEMDRPPQPMGELTDDELDAMLDAAESRYQERHSETVEPAEPAAPAAPRTPRAPSTAPRQKLEGSAALKRATEMGVKGLDQAVKGLTELFGAGPGRLNSFPAGFDEETYRKAKPLFLDAVASFREAKLALSDFMDWAYESFQDGIRPYLRWFIKEQRLTPDLGVPNEPQADSEPRTGPLEGDLPAGIPGPGVGETTGAGVGGRGGADAAGDGGVAGAGGERAGGVGGQPQSVRVPRTGAGRADNYVITEADALGEGTEGEKIAGNLAAIRLIKQLETENRPATAAEQAVLVKYVGWGGLKSVFDPFTSSPQAKRAGEELKQLLTKEEYFQARQSVLNAHYTSREVVGGMYRILEHLGFQGGNILEPTVGTGNFIGLAPAGLRSSRWYAAELDPITSQIAKHLYPQAKVLTSTGFQVAEFPYGKFDLAIGNPPFGDETITDKRRPEINGFKIHNYVIAKSGMHLKPGGVMAMVVTSRFLDTANPEARSHLAKSFKFLGAVRLPSDAFKRTAGTEVTTDIIFLQKRLPGDVAGTEDWLEPNGQITNSRGEKVKLSMYFAKRPELMLGEPTMQGKKLYGAADQFSLMSRPGQNTAELLRDIVNTQTFSRLKDVLAETKTEGASTVIEMNKVDTPVGGFWLEGDKVFLREDDDDDGNVVMTQLTPDMKWTEKTPLGIRRLARIRGMLQLRELAYNQVRMEREDRPTKEIEDHRRLLNRTYDAFVRAQGFLNDSANAGLIDDQRIEFGLEANYRKAVTPAIAARTGQTVGPARADKAALLRERVFYPYKEISKAASVRDGYSISLSEHGKLDLPYIARLTGKTEAEVTDELSEAGLIFQDPETKVWEQEDKYLSGNVKEKLEVAKAAGLEKNITALTKVLPADVPAEQIFADLGGMWIPEEVYNEFGQAVGIVSPAVAKNAATGRISFVGGDTVHSNDINNQWQNQDYSVTEMLNLLMNKKPLIAYDRDPDGTRYVNPDRTNALKPIGRNIREFFRNWLFADPARSELLARAYNASQNTHAPRRYDGSLLKTVGASPDIRLRNSQRDAAWRMLQSPSVLLDHVVGSGKTFTIITGIMERKRLGLSRKPMIAVPNHLVQQWARDWMTMYPGANILAATDKDFAKPNRRRLFARIATGKYDAIIVAHSSFQFIPLSPESQAEFMQEEIAFLERALADAETQKDKRSVRTITNRIAKKQEKLKALMDAPRDSVATFEEMGIDYLAVDEFHKYKNLEFSTTIQAAGMGNAAGARRSFDMYSKIQVLLANGGGVTAATGTPVSNSLVELYTVLRYLNRLELKKRGQDVFDIWAKDYASIESRFEYTATGKIKERAVFASFNNLPELLQLYKEFADVVTMADLKRIYKQQIEDLNKAKGTSERTDFPVPKVANGGRVLEAGEPTALQREYMDYLVARAQVAEQNAGDPEYRKIDNLLWITNDARKMALDIRIVDPSAPDDPNNKVNRSAVNIKRIYDQTTAVKGTQLVFCDLSTPSKMAEKEFKTLINKALAVLQADRWYKQRIQAWKYLDQWKRVTAELMVRSEADETAEADREAIDQFLEENLANGEVLATAADTNFSVYDALKAKLVEMGIPEKEVRFIHEAATAQQKLELFDLVNDGSVRVLLGSTEKMGAGTNVQRRVVAEHHLDSPWKPADIEQREGRVIRQGNLFYEQNPDAFSVEIIAYSTRNTFDAVMWQTLQRKAEGLEQFRNGIRTMEEGEGDAKSYAEFMAESTGNEAFRDKFKLEQQVAELQATRNRMAANLASAHAIVASIGSKRTANQKRLETAQNAHAEVNQPEAPYIFDGQRVPFDVGNILAEELDKYSEEHAEYENALIPYQEARTAWEAADKGKRGVAPRAPVKPEYPTLWSKRVRARSKWAEGMATAIIQLTEKINAGGATAAKTVPIVGPDGKLRDLTLQIQTFQGTEPGEAKRVGITAAYAGTAVYRAYALHPADIMESLTPISLTRTFDREIESAGFEAQYLETSLKTAETTIAQSNPAEVDARLEEMSGRYRKILREVKRIELQEDARRSQQRNRYIASDRNRPLGQVQAGSAVTGGAWHGAEVAIVDTGETGTLDGPMEFVGKDPAYQIKLASGERRLVLAIDFQPLREYQSQQSIEAARLKMRTGPSGLRSRGGQGKGSPVSKVREWIAPMVKALGSVVRFEVVQSIADLGDDTVPTDTEGVYWRGTNIVVLVADNLPTQRRAAVVAIHEVFGHLAAEAHPLFQATIDGILRLKTMGHKKIAEAWEQVAKREPTLDKRAHAAEVLALIAEEGVEVAPLEKLKAKVLALLRKAFPNIEFREYEIRAFIASAGKSLMKRAQRADASLKARAAAGDENAKQFLGQLWAEANGPWFDENRTDSVLTDEEWLGSRAHMDRAYSRAAPMSADTELSYERLFGRSRHPLSLRDHARGWVQRFKTIDWTDLKQGVVDAYESVRRLEADQNGGEILDASDSAWKAMLATRNHASVMAAVMVKGIPKLIDGVYQPVAGRKGFVEILRPLVEHPDGNLIDHWQLWAAANRAQRLMREGKEKRMEQEDIDRGLALERDYPFFRDVLNEWTEFNKQALDLAQEAGILDGEMRAIWEKDDYVPFYRVLDELDVMAPGKKRGFSGQKAMIRQLKGSKAAANDIIENMVMNTSSLIDRSFKNVAMERVVGLAEGHGLRRIPRAIQAALYEVGQIERALANAGIELDNLDPADREQWIKLFRRVAPTGKNVVSLYQNGKPQYFEVDDPLLLRSIQGLGPDNFEDIFRMFTGAKRLLTATVTADPAFMAANLIRDTLANWIQSGLKGNPMLGAMKGIKASLKEDPAVWKIMMAGGGGGGYYDSNPEDIKKLLKNHVPDSQMNGFLDTIVSPKKVWRAWHRVGAATENANRLAVYEAVKKAGGTEAEAIYQARDVLNFTMSGDYTAMRWLISTVPFMNARIQGLYRLSRGYKDHPTAFLMRGLSLLAATMALAAANIDDDEYEELPQWDKDIYWHIFLPPDEKGKREHFRIPKPFELGIIFGTIPERLFRVTEGADRPKDFAGAMGRALGDTLAFNPIPQLVKPAIEQYANRSMFTGSAIVGAAEKPLKPEFQYTPWTSETARVIAKLMPDFMGEWANSPRRIEHAVRAYTGAIGMYALSAADFFTRRLGDFPERPAGKVYETPIISRFVRDPDARITKYSDELYEMLDEANAVFSTVQRLQKSGQREEAAAMRSDNLEKLRARKSLNNIAADVRKINNQIRLEMVSNRTPEEKRARIDALTERKNIRMRQIQRFEDAF